MHTATDYEQEAIRLSRLLDEALGFFKTAVREYAEADNTYRVAHAKAYLAADGPTVDARRAQADIATADERARQRIADGMRQAGLEAIRSRRQQLSAVQSLMSSYRAEAELARTAPEVSP